MPARIRQSAPTEHGPPTSGDNQSTLSRLGLESEELTTQLADMARLHELTVRLSGSSSLTAVLNEVLSAVTSLQHTGMGAAMLYDRERKLLYTVASLGLSEEYLDRLGPLPLGAKAAGIAVKERRGVIVEDVEREPAFAPYRDMARLAGYRAVHGTPLLTPRGETVGALAAYFREPHVPTEHEVRLVELYAKLAAGFVDHARLYDEAQEAIRLRDEILASLSDQLEGPLASIESRMRELRRLVAGQATPPAERIARELAALEALVARASSQLGGLLDATSMDLGRPLRLERRPTDLVALVRGIVGGWEPIPERERFRIVAAAPALIGQWDPVRLRLALEGLLVSAVRSSLEGSTVSITITQRVDDAGDWAVLVVRDRGLGIPDAERSYVFESRPPSPDVAEGQRGGLGLGLGGAHQIAVQHGGSIVVASEEGFGSIVSVSLPLAPLGHATASGTVFSPRMEEAGGGSRLSRTRQWDQARRAEFLSGMPAFRVLPPSALHSLAAASRLRPVERGEAVYLDGEPVEALYVLLTGRLKIVRETDQGKEIILRILSPGEVFGAAGFGTVAVHRVSALAQEHGLVLAVSGSELTSLMNTFPAFTKAMFQLLAAHLREAETRISSLQTESAERRVARVLLQLAARSGTLLASGSSIRLTLSRQDLAALAGTNQGTASRTLSSWSRQGIVRGERKHVVILDLSRLRAAAEGSARTHGRAAA